MGSKDDIGLMIEKIEDIDAYKNEAILFKIINEIAPTATNSFITGTDRLLIVFRTEKDRNDIKKLITKNKIFGPNITVSNAGKKPFVLYAKNDPKSYNEKFIVKRISENFNTETESKSSKDQRTK